VSDLLAVSRRDGCVELWNVAHAPYMQSIIPGTIDVSLFYKFNAGHEQYSFREISSGYRQLCI
jgi:hypothetical protein